jgi:Tetratricopeptide repeat
MPPARRATTPGRARYEESLVMLRELGDRSGMADALNSLGQVARLQGNRAAARTLYAESLAIRRELGHKMAVPGVLVELAGLAADQDEPERALRLAGAALALREAIGAPPAPAAQAELERRLARARHTLGEAKSAAAWAAGEAMPLEEVVAFALGDEMSA